MHQLFFFPFFKMPKLVIGEKNIIVKEVQSMLEIQRTPPSCWWTQLRTPHRQEGSFHRKVWSACSSGTVKNNVSFFIETVEREDKVEIERDV